MTIAVAVRTDSAVVFAADSKLTTRGIVGLEEDGSPRWVEQTYDNATKIAQDRSGTLMAMAAGPANIGRMAATDFIATQTLDWQDGRAEQDEQVASIVAAMVEQKRAFWSTTRVPPAEWPGPTILLAAPFAADLSPRVWRVSLDGEGSQLEEILVEPGVRLEGSYDEVFSLLFGFRWDLLSGLAPRLGMDQERLMEALRTVRVLRPLDQINFWAMPTQDAIDIAVFLANAQVEMDRFLPGTPACGGPIDVMVLQMVPGPRITSYPGKVTHHPNARGRLREP